MKLDSFYNSPTAYVLVGPPGSGKSTWMRSLMANGDVYVVVSSDEEIEAYAKSKGLTYSDVFDSYIKTATALMKSKFNEAIKNGQNIIWDQTNMTAKKRASILQQIPKKYKKIAVVFRVDDAELQRRLEHRAKTEGKFIPKHVIDSMQRSFEMPTLQEGFDEIITV